MNKFPANYLIHWCCLSADLGTEKNFRHWRIWMKINKLEIKISKNDHPNWSTERKMLNEKWTELLRFVSQNITLNKCIFRVSDEEERYGNSNVKYLKICLTVLKMLNIYLLYNLKIHFWLFTQSKWKQNKQVGFKKYSQQLY